MKPAKLTTLTDRDAYQAVNLEQQHVTRAVKSDRPQHILHFYWRDRLLLIKQPELRRR